MSDKLAKEKPPDAPEKVENNNEAGTVDCDVEKSFNNAVEEAVNTLLALTKQEGNEEKAPCKSEAEKEAENVLKKEHDIDRIRKGWTLEDCGTISIGELYLMVKEKLFSPNLTANQSTIIKF